METITQKQLRSELSTPDQKNSRRELWIKLSLSLICLTLSGFAALPFFFMGRLEDTEKLQLRFPITHDMTLHFEQMKSFYNGLAAGEIYPRWEEDTNRGLGAPTTSYYPPAIYYVTSAFYRLSKDWWWAILLTHLLLMTASAAAFFICVRQFASRSVAVIAMTAYLFLPYHLLDQYQRGAMAELLSFIWMPLMILFGEQIFHRAEVRLDGKPRPSILLSIAGLAASYGAFLWSHPPTAYQFSLAFGLYLLGATLLRKDWRGLLLSGSGIIIGAMLSAAYLYVAAAENDLINHENIESTFPYDGSYIFSHHLPFVPDDYGFFTLLNQIWTIGVVSLVLCAFCFFVFGWRTARAQLRERAVLYFITGCFVSFMMLKISDPIGRHLPRLSIGVFSWRMLGILTFVCSLFVGITAQMAFSRDRRMVTRIGFGLLTTLILTGSIIFTITNVLYPMANAPYLIEADEHINFATIPQNVTEAWEDAPVLERATLASRRGEVQIEKWQPQSRRIRVKAASSDTLQVRTFNFPGWTASVNGTPTPILTGVAYQEITVPVPAGETIVQIEYQDTPARQRGKRVTQFAFVLLLTLVIAPLTRINKR